MKRILFAFLVLLSMASESHSQTRSAGQGVVPAGWENDSLVRFGLFGILGGVIDGVLYPSWPRLDSEMDSLRVTFTESWGPIDSTTHSGGLRHGFDAYWINPGVPVLLTIPEQIKQHVWYALPYRLPYFSRNGLFWRYNDVNISGSGATYFNNPYDSNDVSPYSEYPQKDSIVRSLFSSSRSGTKATYYYGDQGRLILAGSDVEDFLKLRWATYNDLLREQYNAQWPDTRDGSGNLTVPDTSQQFSATLDF